MEQLRLLAELNDEIEALYEMAWNQAILLGCILPWKEAGKRLIPTDGSEAMMMGRRSTSCFVIKFGGHCHVNPGKRREGQPALILRALCPCWTHVPPPDSERCRPDRAVGFGHHAVSAWMEVTVDERVSEEEVLRLLGGLEALHLPFSSPCRSM